MKSPTLSNSELNQNQDLAPFKDDMFASLTKFATDSIIVVDNRGRIISWNKSSEKMFGYSKNEAIGQSLQLIIPKKYQSAHKKGMNNFISTKKGKVMGKTVEIEGQKKDQSIFPIELSLSHWDSNDQTFICGIIRDISDRKKNEKQLHQALNKEKELNLLKSHFVATVSHEFRTPLSIIRSNSDLIKMLLEKQKTIEQDQIIKITNRIEDQIERMIQLMNDVLIMSQIDLQSKFGMNLEPIDLFNFCKEQIDNFSISLKNNRKIILKKQGLPRKVNLDQGLIRKTLNNLLSNAIKYSSEEAPIIHVIFDENFVHLHVQDFGIGIPANEQEYIGQSFYRASNVDNKKGSGLGLSIVKEFVQQMNGVFKFKSEEKKGSTFTIIFKHIGE